MVDARELHGKLGSKQDFSNWITNRISDCGFVKDEDYLEVFNNSIVNSSWSKPLGGRPRKDYLLSLDAAKHLAMMERNEAGKHIRAYFIEVEKDWREKALAQPVLPQDYATALRELASKVEQNHQTVSLDSRDYWSLVQLHRLWKLSFTLTY